MSAGSLAASASHVRPQTRPTAIAGPSSTAVVIIQFMIAPLGDWRTHWKRRDETLFPISRALTMDAAYRRKVSEHALSIPLLRFRILVTIGVCILHDDRYDSLTN